MGKLDYARLAFDIRSDGKQLGKFKRHEAHSGSQLRTHATTDDRCANFSASTCPTQALQRATSSTAVKLPLEKFHRLLDLVFWGKFLKLHNYHILYFLHSVPGITRPGEFPWRARGAAARRGQPQLPTPPHALPTAQAQKCLTS